MKKLRSVLITNLIGLVVLFLCLFCYQSIPDLMTSKMSVSHREIQIHEKKLKEKLALCSTESLKKMQNAGKEIQEWNRLLSKTGSHIVAEVLKGQGVFWEMAHYPLNDAFDRETYSQYYYHAHRGGEHGHFHLFLRQGGMGEDILPLFYDKRNATLNDIDTFAHIIAISMDDEGYPIGLFTTNRWVTGEDWYTAEDIMKMVDRFHVEHTHPSYVVNKWLNAMLVLFKPQILDLIGKRDHTLMQYREGIPLKEILEDHNLDVTSETQISLDVQMQLIQELLEEREQSLPL